VTVTHVHPGSHFLDALAEAGVAGARLEWVDILTEGPVHDLGDLGAERVERARALEAIGVEGAVEWSVSQDAALAAAAARGGEFVLWIGDDLHCQLNFLRIVALLDRLEALDRASLARPGPFDPDGGACRLEELGRSAIREAFTRRAPVRGELRSAALAAWRALVSDEPRTFLELLRVGLPELPAMQPAIVRLLLEFPDWRTGLSASEELALRGMRPTEVRPVRRAFIEAGEHEFRRWHTDLTFQAMLERMASGPAPLIRLERGPGAEADGLDRRYCITDHGVSALEATSPWPTRRRLDRWIGGVHVTNDFPWSRAGLNLQRLVSPLGHS
jgi:hypothetical protein